MICPKCRETKAHRSHRHGLKDRVLRIFQMIPYRCHACSTRFYAYRAGEKSSTLRTREERKIMELRRRIRWKRSRGQILAYGVASVLLLGMLYAILRQSIHG